MSNLTRLGSVLGIAMLVAVVPACIYNPTRERAPELSAVRWHERPGGPGYRISPELAEILDAKNIDAALHVDGMLMFTSVSPDDNGAGRIESRVRFLLDSESRHGGRVRQITKLNDLVWHDTEYRFLRLSVAYWLDERPDRLDSGFHWMEPADSKRAAQGVPGLRWVRSVPAMTDWSVNKIPGAKKLAADQGVETNKIVARMALKHYGAARAYIAHNDDSSFKIELVLPDDLIGQVVDEGAAVLIDVTLGHEFRERPGDAGVGLRGVIALRNPKIDGRPVFGGDDIRILGRDRLFTRSILRDDVVALLKARRALLTRLDDLLADGRQDSDEWHKAFVQLRSLQREAATLLLDVTPRELVPLMPAMEAIEEARAGTVVPDGESAVLRLPDGRELRVRSGDVVLRLGSSKQIAVGTFPLPGATRDERGVTVAIDSPGGRNDFLIFRKALAHPSAREAVLALLEPGFQVWSPELREALEAERESDDGHPFLDFENPEATLAFHTALDRYLDAQIDIEVRQSDVSDDWTTVVRVGDDWQTPPGLPPGDGAEVTVDAPEDTPGELIVLTAADVVGMRGTDVADMEAALEARSVVEGPEPLPSPFEIPLNDAELLDRALLYWPGTPFLSHVGVISVERLAPDAEPRAFVYDAYPGEGLMRKTLHQFFVEEGSIGGIFRLRDTDSVVPGLAAAEIVDLYKVRWEKKRSRLAHADAEDPTTDELLGPEDAAPPENRAQAWDSFDYAFDWRNQVRYACSELAWSHYARNGVALSDSLSMLLAPVAVAQEQLGWNVEVLVQATPQSLILSDKLRRVADFDSKTFSDQLEAYDETGRAQTVTADKLHGPLGESEEYRGPTIRIYDQ